MAGAKLFAGVSLCLVAWWRDRFFLAVPPICCLAHVDLLLAGGRYVLAFRPHQECDTGIFNLANRFDRPVIR
jgi:hypothetical protein